MINGVSESTSTNGDLSAAHNINIALNPAVQPLLTDLYQVSMTYSYWRSGKHNESAVFDLFFRKNPFQGEYVVFAGLTDCVEFMKQFRFSESDIEYLKTVLPPTTESEFFDYLRNLDCSGISLRAVPEGTVVFPRVPLLIVEGPLAVCQLLETAFLNLINYASLICTNAARFRLAAGERVGLIEFGLRRAQGPDGAMSASKYSYMGGFDGTSNVLAGKIYGIPIKGTMAHSFVSSFGPVENLIEKCRFLDSADGTAKRVDCLEVALRYVNELVQVVPPILAGIVPQEVNEGELRAFVAFAVSFPNGFLALIDTYDVLKSGLVNFCACALLLNELGYRANGVRIDSGDLAYLSKKVRKAFRLVAEHYDIPWFEKLTIVASNDINEETIYSLNDQGHEIDCFGVGTHLVTCQKQPALGCVYKLVNLKGTPRIKLSEDVAKITIPGTKEAYRLYSKEGEAINDLMLLKGESSPGLLKSVLCRHPFLESCRAFVTASRVELLHHLYWQNGKRTQPVISVRELRAKVLESLKSIRDDHKRQLNPTPYKVSVSTKLYEFFHSYWLQNAPIGQLQ